MKSSAAAVKVTRGTRKAPRNKKFNNEPFGNGPARFTNFSRNARSNNGLMSPGAPMTALALLTRNRTIPGPRGLLTINPEVLPFNAPVTVLNNSNNSNNNNKNNNKHNNNSKNRTTGTLRRRRPQRERQVLLVEAPDEEGRQGQVVLVEAPNEEGQVLLVEAPNEEGREGQVVLGEAPDGVHGEQGKDEEEDEPNLLYECMGLALIVGGLYYGFQVFSGQQTTM
jgi:hypothetical protein